MPVVRWTSNKRSGDGTSRIVLEGSSADPVREIWLGSEGELSEEELSKHSKYRNFTNVDGNESSTGVEEQPQQPQEPEQSVEQDEEPAVQPPPGVVKKSSSSIRKTRN